MTAAVRELRDRHPGPEVRTRHLEFGQERAALPGHRIDAILAPEPIPAGRLRVRALYDEPRYS
ncbi:hypothetical protein [Streptomyces sp. NPDC050738]|uniref:hypothetical protein n=1 Tax=Streptomyces sp. NPDC050738 TaxID=3154744 RepID=UPI00342B1C7A